MAGAYDEKYGVNQVPVPTPAPQQAQPSVAPQAQLGGVAPAMPQTAASQQPQPYGQVPFQPFGQEGGLPAYHVHHSYIWLNTIRAVLAVLFIVMISSFSSVLAVIDEIGYSGIGMVGMILGGSGVLFLVFVGLVVLVHVLAYKRLYFTLGPNEFSLYSGIITKKRVHVPYDRVQSVDARASLIQRVFGVRNVFIDTAGGAANKAVLVPSVTKAQAEWLTAELYARKRQVLAPQPVAAPASPQVAGQPIAAAAPQQSTNVLDYGKQAWDEVGGVFAGAPVQEMVPSFEYGMTNKQLFLAGLSNNTSFVLLVLGFLAAVGQVADFAGALFPQQTDQAGQALDSLFVQAADPLVGMSIAASIVGILVVLAIVWVLSAIGSCISYGGFRARRVGDRVEVERGLLQHTRQSISIQRVQAVVVKQSVIRRLIGYCEVSLDKIDAAASDDAGQQKNSLNATGVVVHPFCKLADVPAILTGLVPEYAGIPQDRTPLAPVALRRGIVRRCLIQGGGFWLAVAVVIIQAIMNALFDPAAATTMREAQENAQLLALTNPICFVLYGIALACFVLELVSAIRWARESGFAVNRQFMKVVNGGLSREERSFPRTKIQYGYARTNPFQRLSKVATLNARTAAGIGGTTVSLWDVSEEDADAWLDWLKPRL